MKVLLAEDDRFLGKAAAAFLRRHGYTVAVAVDGEDVLRQATMEPPDIVLLDIILPKLQGFEVLRRLKAAETTQAIPVVMLSNLGQPEDIAQASSLGAVHYALKANTSLEELAALVARVLAGAQR